MANYKAARALMGKGNSGLRRNAGEGAAGLSNSSRARKGSRAGQQRKEGRQEVRGEEGETQEVTLATAFSRRAREPGDFSIVWSGIIFSPYFAKYDQ